MFGINVDVANDPAYAIATPARLKADGFKGVRCTSLQQHQDRMSAYVAEGLTLMGIVTWDSEGYVPHNATWLQIHNEMTSGQDPMSPEQYVDEYKIYRNTYGGQFLYATGGLAMGPEVDIPWMQEVLDGLTMEELPDAIAIHPYTLSPAAAAATFDQYWNAFGIPVIATEWYHQHTTNWIWDFQSMLGNPNDGRSTLWNSWFCYTDAMVPPLGLTTDTGDNKPEYYSLLSCPEVWRQ